MMSNYFGLFEKTVLCCFYKLFSKKIGSPVLIVGCGHSGTSLLLSILSAHPDFMAVSQETNMFLNLSKKNLISQIYDLNTKTKINRKKRWVEKTPKHITCLNRIFDVIPNAKVIIMIRDGRDVAYSHMKRGTSLEEGMNRWINDNLAAKPFYNNKNIYLLKYESIIENFYFSIKNLLAFLDEPYFTSVEKYYETEKLFYSPVVFRPKVYNESTHNQYRNWQINQPIFDSRSQWINLNKDEIYLLESMGGQLLGEFNYI